jgi:CheY-like chemotaxis protein
LLAEDNLINQKIASKLLESRGHTVRIVQNGREALAALESAEFDLVLMDIQMPLMDGFACTAEIRRKERTSGDHLPIVAITAHASSGDGERCAQAGVDEYVTKPLRPRELFQAIQLSLSARMPSRVS